MTGRRWLGILCIAGGVLCFSIAASYCLGGCKSQATAQSPTVDPRALARGTVETLETVWNDTAKGCVQVAVQANDENILKTCQNVLNPSRDALIAAAEAVDSWTDADQKNFPCLISDAMSGFVTVGSMLKAANVTLPQVVTDGFTLAGMYTPACTSRIAVDAGGQ